ncbi:lipoate--protein ligase family protein [Candidatus Bathyarchaeota archaeon]|nr:lipoate--protein ligase family protein [Candidatus Bathyarchaeota archaeon]
MADNWRMIDYSSEDPAMNLAIDEAVLRSVLENHGSNTLRLWQNPPAVVIGHFQNPKSAVSIADCEMLGIGIFRRVSGGGAVYHDYGNLNYSIIVRKPSLAVGVENVGRSYTFFCGGVVEGLGMLGVQARNNGGNIAVEGKKISGSAQHRLYDAILHHGTCMVNVDFSMLGRALRIQNPHAILVNLSEILESITMEKTKNAIRKGYEKTCGANLKKGSLTPNEMRTATSLNQTKYNNRDWNG